MGNQKMSQNFTHATFPLISNFSPPTFLNSLRGRYEFREYVGTYIFIIHTYKDDKTLYFLSPKFAITQQAICNQPPSHPRNEFKGKGKITDFKNFKQHPSCYMKFAYICMSYLPHICHILVTL